MNVDDVGKNKIVGGNEKLLRRKSTTKDKKKINGGEIKDESINKVVRRRNCIKWRADLHAK
ncbi:hypothetical protein H5410_056380, partial [Solanum commersonii]